jgi:hypothetical protein
MPRVSAKRIHTRVGDVFAVPLGDGSKKYFQYVANDLTQLNSSVIRAFKKTYPIEAKPDLQDVVRDDVDFHAHVVIRWGIEMYLWEKVGNVSYDDKLGVLFRNSTDYGDPKIKTSYNWQVWRINEGFRAVGRLEGNYQKAEIGIVVTAQDIVHRMRTGKYNFAFPGY